MKVLVVVDMQNDFISGSLGTKEALKIVDNVILKIKAAEENNDIILFTKDTHDKDYLNTFEGVKLPVPHCIKNTIGWEIPKEILRNHQVVFEKETFGSLRLIEYLKTLEFDEIELIGICTDICVISNVMLVKANFPDKKIVVDSKCCSGVSVESHNEALNVMRMCHIDVI